MSEYSNFPFQEFSTEELGKMMVESILLGDDEFAIACREEIKKRLTIEDKNEYSQSQKSENH